METKLFTTQQVKRFFDKLYSKGRNCCELYKGIDKLNHDRTTCEKEVFVNRTLKRWFSGKYVIFFQEDEQSGIEYKRYIYLSNISYALSYRNDLTVYYLDFTRPYDI